MKIKKLIIPVICFMLLACSSQPVQETTNQNTDEPDVVDTNTNTDKDNNDSEEQNNEDNTSRS